MTRQHLFDQTTVAVVITAAMALVGATSGGRAQTPAPAPPPVAPLADIKLPPAFSLPAHVAVAGLHFYTGTQFPEAYRNSLFVALHGSTTISQKVGYKVVRLVMKAGQPSAVEDFASGWLKDGVVTGRPSGLMTGADGALYLSDDSQGFIYRIVHQ